MVVSVGNFGYFFFLGLAAILIAIIILFLRNKSDKYIYRFLLGISVSALILHFSKLLFQPYRGELPYSLKKISFENICAVSTLIFPFIYVSKNNLMKTYMVYIGIISGIASLVYPTEAFNRTAFQFDVLRFYYAHFTILAVPILMIVFDVYRPDYKKFWYLPVGFIIILCVILLNEVLVLSIGLDGTDGMSKLLDSNYRNSSFIFGLEDNYLPVRKIITWCVPDLFLSNPVTHEKMYWPIIWLVIPVFIYFSIFSIIISMTYDFSRIKSDFSKWYSRVIKKEVEEISQP